MTASSGPRSPRVHRFLPLTALALAGCALLVPAVAVGAAWDTTTVAYDSEVVARIDGTGAAEAVGGFDYFGAGTMLSSVTRPWRGPWSAPTPIVDLPVPFAPDGFIQQASNSTGDVVLLAQRGYKGDLVAHGRTRGVVLAPQVLTTGGIPNGAPVRLVMNDAGDALVAWQADGTVRVATRAPDGVWSAAVTLDREAQPFSGATMDAALNNAGDALVVWRHRQRSPNTLRSAQRVAGGAWLTPRAFGGRRQGAGDATVALDDTGGAVVAWHLVRLRVGIEHIESIPVGGAEAVAFRAVEPTAAPAVGRRRGLRLRSRHRRGRERRRDQQPHGDRPPALVAGRCGRGTAARVAHGCRRPRLATEGAASTWP